jgi:UDP-N-acetylglucosamine diphosphorylase / glucose-1-phosphate thymidylyltransferase / UDP-N-acetylgalactosamine diphosphorylase / glucosamine-1-phosphate N-acetyltransferase / galactosamine-1-phosphate N-acetyltransferase
MRRIAFFEDNLAENFRPLSFLRPVFELRCGHFSVRERVQTGLGLTEWGAFVRPQLADVYREEFPQARVNDDSWLRAGSTVLINGRWLGDISTIANLTAGQAVICDGTIVAIAIEREEADLLVSVSNWNDVLPRLAKHRSIIEARGGLVEYPWHLIEENPDRLSTDFRMRKHGASKANLSSQVSVIGRDEDVYIDPGAQIDPFVVIDARTGPVWIDAGVVLQPFTRLEGPCFVGRDSQLFRANIRGGTSIGAVCRVGGEIEASIIHGYANKYHDGFLGHSYVCPWVNLGALSTNSDLKNDYSAVRVPLWGEALETGSTKVGCFIADHAKAALCSLFNTGTSVGVMGMILPAGELLPKHLPSFTRYWHGQVEEITELDSFLETARVAMSRRKCTLTPAMERLVRFVFEQTAEERAAAFDRAATRRESPFAAR